MLLDQTGPTHLLMFHFAAAAFLARVLTHRRACRTEYHNKTRNVMDSVQELGSFSQENKVQINPCHLTHLLARCMTSRTIQVIILWLADIIHIHFRQKSILCMAYALRPVSMKFRQETITWTASTLHFVGKNCILQETVLQREPIPLETIPWTASFLHFISKKCILQENHPAEVIYPPTKMPEFSRNQMEDHYPPTKMPKVPPRNHPMEGVYPPVESLTLLSFTFGVTFGVS
ncbi:hypothetical protein Drorol1_Dr00021834 [Drosera rotundifolia]